ncbi:Mitochondrial fatty acid anion carrier protein/Uncoupling protein [Ceraceosorus bombacis]|uniref:Mitochondrial fatty acid anion carrier protein/Uncoupling protein n=1 Tax=Ceraceosorus bombacis TaxID=401625 RepID=A0A0P1BLT8_9BASI|nr:Mitochondrial fatty acid anion carrier protein/Uncoupling protein [Ceraceosorus bombacis]
MARKEASLLAEEETLDKAVPASQPDPSISSHRLKLLTYASALLGNSTSAVVTNPFDIIKVRQQLALSSRHNFWTLGREMVVGEGVQSLWYGVTASILREASYGTIRMGSYETFKDLYAPLLGPSVPFLQKLLAGVTSGALGALIASPCDLVKVQMQASRTASVGGAPPYRNTFVAFSTIYHKGGLKALWRGVGPTTLRAAVLTSTQVGTKVCLYISPAV